MQGFGSQLQTEVKRKYTLCFNGVLYVTANARYLILCAHVRIVAVMRQHHFLRNKD